MQKNRYVKDFQVYTGKEGNRVTTQLVMKVILELNKVLEEGRNITTDNFFKSHKLALELAKRKLTLHGTIKKRKEVPKSMI